MVRLSLQRNWLAVVLAVLGAQTGAALAAPAGDTVSFNHQIQPILSEYCYHCHGPDSATRKPKKQPLRLDRAQFAFEPRDGGTPVIDKEHPEKSELLRRIRSADSDEVMPPPAEKKEMKEVEKALLEKWVRQGARYEEHWSFVPPVKSAPPVEASGWALNPIDHFVAARLRESGLRPNGMEDRSRLFRRLSFDLTGLPPSSRELESFLSDRSAKAYERAVDRLLASDASAEHFARQWLDAVRYADTQGIHHDHVRSIWPYRDWVIGAFKTNLPFDKFTIQQLAGDLLPDASLDAKVASGYNRLLPTTGEGGAIEDEYTAIYAKDRVDTTAAVWLGLTTGCATCHDHKFDPITTKDFYALTAFFRNSTVRTLDNGRDANTAPVLFVPRPGDRARLPEITASIDERSKDLTARKAAARGDFEKWVGSRHRRLPDEPARDGLQVSMGYDPAWVASTKADGNSEVSRMESTNAVSGDIVKGAEPSFGRRDQASYGALVWVEGKPTGALFSRMDKSEKYRGWDLFLTDGRPTVHIVDEFPDAALKVTAKDAIEPGAWHHVMAVFDGGRAAGPALTLYVDGRPVVLETNNSTLGTNLTTKAPFRLGGRSEGSGVTDKLAKGAARLQDVRFYHRAMVGADVERLAARGAMTEFFLPWSKQAAAKKEKVFDHYLLTIDPPSQKIEADLARLRAEQDSIQQRGGTSLVMGEKTGSEATASILIRGNYASKGAPVSAATPEALPPMPADAPRNRLGLARWIVSPANPLTARVTVNRVWAQLFGTGIVETTEDFGVMGARPVNQELLDWLAVDFVESGWDYRRLVKTLVMSAAYRQSAVVTPEKLEKDPLNRLLSRGPRLRLEAEQIRDLALAASGLLVRQVGGPPVRPYQPEGVWEAVAMKVSNTRVYERDSGSALYRRSLYTFWKRTAPPPSMEILNAPSREVFCTRRERSNTPLQAFVTMNDPQFVEASRQLAARALDSSRRFDGRLDYITRALIARRLTDSERVVVRRLADRAQANYREHPEAARSLVAVGDSKTEARLSPEELAVWTLVASEVMNLDETLTK